MHLSLKQLVPAPLQEQLSKKQSDVWLQDWDLKQGEYVFVQAPSGTGKSTLIHSLYGIRQDYEGQICWQDQNLRQFSDESLANLRSTKLSIVFQDLRLFPELSATENLEIKRQLTKSIDQKTMFQWMDFLGIGHKKNALAATLSYGEQQRLAILRALVQPFSFLLMDEPFSHLDQDNIQKAAELILQVVQHNQAALLLADLDANHYFPYHKTLHL